MRRLPILLILALGLAGCVGPKERGGARPRVSGPALSREPSASETRQCQTDLADAGIRFSPVPPMRSAGGCSQIGAIRLDDMGLGLSGLGPVRCALAARFVAWARGPLQEAAAAWLGSPVIAVETFGSYACRPVNNQSGGRLSEHGVADAIDLSAFRLADGRRITVLGSWFGADENARDFLRALHHSACARFGVVLGPDANAQHRDHVHIDLAPGRYCR